MASTLVEQTRLQHQDIEVHRQHIIDDLLDDSKSTRDRIQKEHRMKIRLDKIEDSAKRLLELYEDTDGVRAEELAEMTGENVFSTFYDRLKSIREYHRQFPEALPPEENEIKPKVKFQGAEYFGMFVDVHPFFQQYVNMPMFDKCDYRSYLSKFDKFAGIPKEKKLKIHYAQYKQYVTELENYLSDFQSRTNVLVDVDELKAIMDESFKESWDAKTVSGWHANTKAQGNTRGVSVGGGSATASRDDEQDPLYCKICTTQFKKHTTYTNHLSGRKHKKKLAQEGIAQKEDPCEMEL
jgi:splicing factor 3A subunit 3